MRFDHLILAARAWGGPRSEMAARTKAAQTGGTGVRMCQGLYSNADIPVNENRPLERACHARMHDSDPRHRRLRDVRSEEAAECGGQARGRRRNDGRLD